MDRMNHFPTQYIIYLKLALILILTSTHGSIHLLYCTPYEFHPTSPSIQKTSLHASTRKEVITSTAQKVGQAKRSPAQTHAKKNESSKTCHRISQPIQAPSTTKPCPENRREEKRKHRLPQQKTKNTLKIHGTIDLIFGSASRRQGGSHVRNEDVHLLNLDPPSGFQTTITIQDAMIFLVLLRSWMVEAMYVIRWCTRQNASRQPYPTLLDRERVVASAAQTICSSIPDANIKLSSGEV
ncbi:hypothetical protein EYC80_004908 [Monilinia laxa]|uniref:Uncharacterized protein n=1 Tax=Monilinia laxa TaxID=61186 RepID=A0A5N6KIA3_MONLA|nr:hypothetical protein EYC80_004908 [Monilinia laxa]